MENSKIAWTDHTQNFFWGCTKVSPGCQNCYAQSFSKRVGRDIWGPTAARWRTSAKNWQEPRKWNRQAEADGVRRRVFCQSMSDTFENRADLDGWRDEMWPILEATPHLDWLLLTKRPENILPMVPRAWWDAWPSNVWVGTSVESQEVAEQRIPALLKVPARVRFLSCEPLLGPVDLWRWLRPSDYVPANLPLPRRIEWVIVGGESGGKARPMNLDWARQIRDDCAKAGTAFFMKQVGGTRDKGERLEQIPLDLRIRQFPQAEM